MLLNTFATLLSHRTASAHKLSAQSFNDAIRRAFPPTPLVYISPTHPTFHFHSSHSPFVPLSYTGCSFHIPEAVTARLSEFRASNGYVSATFLSVPITPNPTRAIRRETTGVSLPVPFVVADVLRCARRVSLLEMEGTVKLQSELRRTEADLLRHIEQTCANHLQCVCDPRSSLGALQLVWERDGWFLEDASLAAVQSRQVVADASCCYAHAWLRPLRRPFLDTAPNDSHLFVVPERVHLVHWEARHALHAMGQRVPKSWDDRIHDGMHYLAETGKRLRWESTASNTDALEDAKEGLERRPAREGCWFALATLAEKQLRPRSHACVETLPVRYNGCGFFLHNAPWWFRLAWTMEDVLRMFPWRAKRAVLADTFGLDGRKRDRVASLSTAEVDATEDVVGVLHSNGEWDAYPRVCGKLNFRFAIPKPKDDLLPWLFIDIHAALRLMRVWSQTQQKKWPNPNRTNHHDVEYDPLMKLFAPNENTPLQCVAAFIEALIQCCARPVEEDSSTQTSHAILEHLTENPTAQPATTSSPSEALKNDLSDDAIAIKERRNRALCFDDEIGDDVLDFPAIDRRIYNRGHRLSQAYTHPQEEARQRGVPTAHSLDATVADEIVHVIRQQKSSENTTKLDSTDDEESNTEALDLGIVALSFLYTVEVVNSTDLEMLV